MTAEEDGLMLTAYVRDETIPLPLPLSVAAAGRGWMAETYQHFAKRCLPLLIANQAGWFILNNQTFHVTWNGDNGRAGIAIEYEEENHGLYRAVSHFGYGIVTWHLPYLFRTSPGYNLLARGPANWPKDGIAALEGIIETDWAVASFTMNWKMTRVNAPVTFEKHEPICMLVPQRRGELEQFEPTIRAIASEPLIERAHLQWSKSRILFLCDRKDPDSEAVKQGWQKDYFHGRTPGGVQAAEHQSKLRLRDFSISDLGCAWHPLLEEPLRSRALEVAHVVAERMRDPDQISAIATRAMHQSKWPGRWDPVSKPFGFTQIAFPFVSFRRCFSGQEWDRAAQRYLRLAAAATHKEDIATPALFGGTCGLASVLLQVGRQDGRSIKTLASLNTQICQQVRDTPWQRGLAPGIAASDYDIISGAAGVFAYLVTIEVPTDEVLGAIRILVQYLISLAESDRQETRERWYIAPQWLSTDEDRDQYPDGQVNCGLAHGIAGPLAALSIAWNEGYRFAGLREAIVSLSQWVLRHQMADEWGINWPSVIPFSRSEATNEPEATNGSQWHPARAAWCDGAPGMARALWLAGVALDDETLRQRAIEAMETVLRRPIVARGMASPNLCHGMAGLLQICLRFAHETGNETIRQHIPLLVTQILDLFDPEFALGFRDLDADGVGIDEATWLTGAPGTALALLAAATAVPPDWDRMLLIS